jgi:hypothetical protein
LEAAPLLQATVDPRLKPREAKVLVRLSPSHSVCRSVDICSRLRRFAAAAQSLAVLKEGDLFGEIALLFTKPRARRSKDPMQYPKQYCWYGVYGLHGLH